MNWLTKCETYKELFLSDLKGLVAIPSVENLEEAKEGAPFGEAVRISLDYMLEMAKRDGFEVKDYDGYAGVIMYGEGEESVGVLGHLDIVPIGEGWSKDPYGCEIQDGYIFGRGITDDKGPTMAAYYALKMLKDNNIKFNKKVLLILGCNEETGMVCMDYYKEHGEIPTCGFSPDADFPVVYGEKGHVGFTLESSMPTRILSMHAGERPNIVIGRASATLPKMSEHEKAMFAYYLKSNQLTGNVVEGSDADTIEIEGKYYHAALCYYGVNAALHILNFVGTTYDDVLASSIYALLKDWKGTPMNIALEGGHMGFLTVNTGIVNIENNQTYITVDIRYPNETNGKELESKIVAAVANVNAQVKVENFHDSAPLFVDPKSKLIQVLENSYRQYTNDYETPIKTMGGGTYARKFDNFVAYGAEFPQKEETSFSVGGPHEKDEGMKIDNLMKAMAIYAQAIEDLGI